MIISTLPKKTLIPQPENPNSNITKYTHSIATPQGLGVIGMLVILAVMNYLSRHSNNKNKIGSSYWGSSKETSAAVKIAKKQIAAPQCDSAALYIGKLPDKKKQEKGRTPFFIPEVQRGTAVIGAPGSGKTFSAINPMVYSAIDQGFPIILYDFKYPSQAKIGAYATRMGYKVHVFAPGFPESEVCNPLDFIRDSTDAETARQIATVINKNFKILSNSSEDGFFAPAGEQLTQAILMLTKEFGDYADVMTAAAILSSDQMVHRLMAADLNPWVKIALGQLFSSSAAEKTVAGITATASIMFTRFMAKNTVGCFVGKTTLPLEIKGKQIIIFGLDRERRDAVGPLLTSVLHMTIARNIAKKRQDPLIVTLDELPSLYLPDLFKWLNESRSEGFCGLLGWQNMGQLEKIYGKDVAKTILGATGTKFVFNPGETESAQLFSNYLGEEELKTKQKSKSTGGGKSSTSISEQDKQRKLLDPAQFLKLPPGKCVFINPGYCNKKEGSIPLLKAIKVPKFILEIDGFNKNNWDRLIGHLMRKSTQRFLTQEDLDLRIQAVNEKFPLPQNNSQPVQSANIPKPISPANLIIDEWKPLV